MRKKREVPALSPTERKFAEELYREYAGLMFHTALRLTGDRQEAEDLVQETLIALMRNISKIFSLDRCKIAGYIVITIRRLNINCSKTDGGVIALGDAGAELQSSGIKEHVPLDADARLDVLWLMDALPPRDRYLLEQWYLYGCSEEELSRELDCKPESLRGMLSRVRRRAAALLQEEKEKGD